MPWLTQMIYFALLFLGIALALWLSIWILLALFAVGIVVVAWAHLKQFLLAKGILNPTPGVRAETGVIIDHAPQARESVTLIEGDYKRVDSE